MRNGATQTINAAPQPPRIEDLPDVITAEQAAAVLQCTTNHVYALCREGRLPSRKVGRLVRIPKAAFLRWLEVSEDAV